MQRACAEFDDSRSLSFKRLAGSLKAVFDDRSSEDASDFFPAVLSTEECPWEGGYDLSIGTSERGESLGLGRLPKFRPKGQSIHTLTLGGSWRDLRRSR